MKILVIEDNPTNMKLICSLLSKSGHQAFQAADAETGINMTKELLPDLILMDIQLPGMDGLEATRLLKGSAKTGHIPVVALTAFAMKGDEEKMLEVGCDAYVAKPIRYKEFLATIATYDPVEGQGVESRISGSESPSAA